VGPAEKETNLDVPATKWHERARDKRRNTREKRRQKKRRQKRVKKEGQVAKKRWRMEDGGRAVEPHDPSGHVRACPPFARATAIISLLFFFFRSSANLPFLSFLEL